MPEVRPDGPGAGKLTRPDHTSRPGRRREADARPGSEVGEQDRVMVHTIRDLPMVSVPPELVGKLQSLLCRMLVMDMRQYPTLGKEDD
jgi:hypothetical protein